MYAKSKSTAAVHADGNANHPDDEQRGIYQTCTAQTFFVSQVAEFLITVTTPGRGCFVSGAMARNACASMRTASDVGHQSVDCEIPRMQLITDHENEPTAQIVEAASAVFSSLILLSRGESVDVGDVTLRLGEPIRSGNFEYQYYARDLAMPGGDYTHAPSGTQTRPDLDELFEQDIVFTETGPDPDLPPFRRAPPASPTACVAAATTTLTTRPSSSGEEDGPGLLQHLGDRNALGNPHGCALHRIAAHKSSMLVAMAKFYATYNGEERNAYFIEKTTAPKHTILAKPFKGLLAYLNEHFAVESELQEPHDSPFAHTASRSASGQPGERVVPEGPRLGGEARISPLPPAPVHIAHSSLAGDGVAAQVPRRAAGPRPRRHGQLRLDEGARAVDPRPHLAQGHQLLQ